MSSRWVGSLSIVFFAMAIGSNCAPAGAQSRVYNDVDYGRSNGSSQLLDATIPAGEGPFPAAIIVHGGAWVSGNRKANVQPLFRPLTAAGFAWFSIDYTLMKDISQLGDGVGDVERAIAFVKMHAAQYRVNPDKIALIGESAGGQLAAMAALSGEPGTRVRAVVAMYAPTDLASLARSSTYIPPSYRNAVAGTPFEGLILAGLAELSPINRVSRDMPPFLFIHGTADTLVPFEQSVSMCDRMKAAGAKCEVYPVHGGGHGMLWWQSDGVGTGYRKVLIDWLDKTLGVAGPARIGH
ncbi:MAG TPA: alpha/beta hydrolase [Bryobacteraceae bacterium]|nr:alpha/beta hydrolase [Bryobacteraceae bacterium]